MSLRLNPFSTQRSQHFIDSFAFFLANTLSPKLYCSGFARLPKDFNALAIIHCLVPIHSFRRISQCYQVIFKNDAQRLSTYPITLGFTDCSVGIQHRIQITAITFAKPIVQYLLKKVSFRLHPLHVIIFTKTWRIFYNFTHNYNVLC